MAVHRVNDSEHDTESQARENALKEFQQRDQLESGFLSGLSNEVKETVFRDYDLASQPPFEAASVEEAQVQRVAQTVFDSLHDVLRQDWLVIWHMQYGIIDTAGYVQNLLRHFNVSETVQKIQDLLAELDAFQSEIQSLHLAELAGRDKDARSQDGKALTGGQLYIFGVREGLRYALQLVEKVKNGEFAVKPSNSVAIPESMAAFGVFADQQRHFVEKVLPKLQDIFKNRPNSINVKTKK